MLPITEVAPPSDKINSSVYQLQNQVRPLHSSARISLHNFWHTCMSWYSFSFNQYLIQGDATWQKTATHYLVIINNEQATSLSFLASWLKSKCYNFWRCKQKMWAFRSSGLVSFSQPCKLLYRITSFRAEKVKMCLCVAGRLITRPTDSSIMSAVCHWTE